MNPCKVIVSLLLFAVVLTSCQTDQERIAQRWVFTNLETKSSKALSKAFDAGLVDMWTVGLRKKIQGNRLILDKNGSCYGVLLNRYFAGEWEWTGIGPGIITRISSPKKITLKWDILKQGGSQLQLGIDAEKMQRLTRTIGLPADSTEEASPYLDMKGDWIISAEKEPNQFDAKMPDPWAPENNQWRMPPNKPETTTQLQQRVRNHLVFMYSFFNFASQGDRYWVSQDWFFSVIKPGNNGIAIYSEKKIPAQWYGCFYDSTQAQQGYELVRQVFHEKIEVPTESNGLLFNKQMLERIITAYDKMIK